MAQEKPIRVGGVGTGRIFSWGHLRIYPRLLDRARLTAFYDVDTSRARAAMVTYAERLKEYALEHSEAAEAVDDNLSQLAFYESLDELLDHVDLIDVCTTTRGRMPSALAALGKGVHSMLEKPMARTWTEADRAVRAFGAAPSIFCQYNDDNVFDPKYRVLHDLIGQGLIGNVQSMWLIRGSELSATSVLKSQANGRENGGGCLMDYGSHGLAAAWYALGMHHRITRAEAVHIGVLHRNRVLEGEAFVMEVDDNARVKFLLEDPDTGRWITLYLEASWCGGHIGGGTGEWGKRGGQAAGFLRVEGDEGVIDATRPDVITVTRWDGGITRVPLVQNAGERASMTHEISDCIESIRTDTPPQIDIRFGAEVVAACGAAYLSAIRGQAVTMDDFKQYCGEAVQRHGGGEAADTAILEHLLSPYKQRASA